MSGENREKKGLNISASSFVTAIAVLFALMALTYLLTFIVPGGAYERVADESGNLVLNTASFHAVKGGIPFWKWLLSPVLVLGASGSGSLIAVIVFLLVIGGIFNSLDKCRLMAYMLERITHRFGGSRYRLMAAVVLFFMGMGSLIGSFEECVPLVPIVVALASSLGWDALTGMGMSILAAGCGFAAGVCNPFTVGVAQELAGLPMFSGIWLRIVSFVLIYALLLTFLSRHARQVERPLTQERAGADFVANPAMDRGLLCFCLLMGAGILLVLSSIFIRALQDYTMIVVAVMFLAAGLSACLVAGMKPARLGRTFLDGVLSILPAVLMILMANSVRFTLEEANILDTILHGAVLLAGTLPRWVVILFVYACALVMNLFIPSGSAKAFLLIPLLAPLAGVFGISAQLVVLAYAFGDGFSNALYPTNPVLLISLGMADVNWGRWARWSGKFQLANLLLTSLILLLGLAVGYA